jgi:hypothetical protein
MWDRIFRNTLSPGAMMNAGWDTIIRRRAFGGHFILLISLTILRIFERLVLRMSHQDGLSQSGSIVFFFWESLSEPAKGGRMGFP